MWIVTVASLLDLDSPRMWGRFSWLVKDLWRASTRASSSSFSTSSLQWQTSSTVTSETRAHRYISLFMRSDIYLYLRAQIYINMCKKCLWVIYIYFLHFNLSNINIFHSIPNYHDVLCFNVSLLYRSDQSSFRRIWSPWLILLTTILLHLFCLMCFEL